MERILILKAGAGEELEVYSMLHRLREAGYAVDDAPALALGRGDVDGNMVSATGWTDLAEWSRAFMEVLDRATVPA